MVDINKLQVELEMAADYTGGGLGRPSRYVDTYSPTLLHPILREDTRREVGIPLNLVCQGQDLWTGYEFSWLDRRGVPQVAGLRLRVPCQSPSIVESKSLKLYLNSLAMTKFDSLADVNKTLDQDLTGAFGPPLIVELLDLAQLNQPVQQFAGVCLEKLDVDISHYDRAPGFLGIEDETRIVRQSFYTNVFRSLCPVTGQPDWASISIDCMGMPIEQAGLFKYLVSYRNHPAFHETTVEQIYHDLTQACRPQSLSVYGRFQRRGGLDINPFRSNDQAEAPLCRLPRQ